jgi:NAD+ synthase (glutamine-hydrolysing)
MQAVEVTAVELPLLRPQLSQTPFVPSDPERRASHCEEVFAIQSTGLAKRLRLHPQCQAL